MRLYIDPGTGSMLFAILIGIIGALNYLVRVGFVKLRFILSGGKKTQADSQELPYVIFSDNKRYWNVFKPICEEFDRRGIDIAYMTASQDDPALSCGLEHINARFVGSGNMAFARLNFLQADIVLSTTPGLDVYQWKRSKAVKCYVHMLHAASEISLYRMFGIDYYDCLLLSGDFQAQDVRRLEKLRGLPAKEIYMVGIPYMDEMVKRLKAAPPVSHATTVLLAPSWGASAIFSRYGGSIIDKLLATGYHIIIRPHPQSFESERPMLEKLMAAYPPSDMLEWNRDVDNFDVLNRSDLLISDFSGVTFEFALVYDKPIIYADTHFDRAPYDAWWLDGELWTETALPRLGMQLNEGSLDKLKEMIDRCIQSPEYAAGREAVRGETWQYYCEGTKRTVDWLVEKHDSLLKQKEGEEK